MRLSADDIDKAWFPPAPFGTRGYNQMQVDAFLNRIAAALDGRDDVTAADVRNVAFTLSPMGRRGGYDPAAVDAFLRIVERALATKEAARTTTVYVAPALEHSHARKPLWRRIRA